MEAIATEFPDICNWFEASRQVVAEEVVPQQDIYSRRENVRIGNRPVTPEQSPPLKAAEYSIDGLFSLRETLDILEQMPSREDDQEMHIHKLGYGCTWSDSYCVSGEDCQFVHDVLDLDNVKRVEYLNKVQSNVRVQDHVTPARVPEKASQHISPDSVYLTRLLDYGARNTSQKSQKLHKVMVMTRTPQGLVKVSESLADSDGRVLSAQDQTECFTYQVPNQSSIRFFVNGEILPLKNLGISTKS